MTMFPPAASRLSAPEQEQQLAQVAEACDGCRRCGLGSSRIQVVVSRGDPRSPLMVIGEGPGAQEDEQGKPFVGRSGQLLDRLLESAGIDSNRDAYVCNIVKCRPPENRKPTALEMAACRPWLDQQIALVDPPVILLAGATAVEGLLGIKGGIINLINNRSGTGKSTILQVMNSVWGHPDELMIQWRDSSFAGCCPSLCRVMV